MTTQAPYEYIANYYDQVQKKNKKFPEIADFWLSGFRHVKGKRILNLGCGPMFYDNLLHFGEVPDYYVGLDLNENSFSYLENSDHPSLISAKKNAEEKGIETEFITGSVFDHVDDLAGQFDTIIGIGFFATFEKEVFDKLFDGCYKMLKDKGQILKMTWHGAQRTEKEQEKKLEYRYDNEDEPAAEELIRLIEKQKFSCLKNDVLNCPPDTVGWNSIQVALFEKA